MPQAERGCGCVRHIGRAFFDLATREERDVIWRLYALFYLMRLCIRPATPRDVKPSKSPVKPSGSKNQPSE